MVSIPTLGFWDLPRIYHWGPQSAAALIEPLSDELHQITTGPEESRG